ncbi:MAG: aminoglycoside phosphotransferase family enzyme/predicted kinase [Hyphomicrobiaceae bacterium]
MTTARPLDETTADDLLKPDAYPDDPSTASGLHQIQTHISRVFLSGERVYKFRKPVAFDFVDFSTIEARNHDCCREVELNRRLAANVYFGIAPLLTVSGHAVVGPVGETIVDPTLEHCVVMRRLPDGRDGLSLLDKNLLGVSEIDQTAERIAEFHRHAQLTPVPVLDRETWYARVSGPMLANFESFDDETASVDDSDQDPDQPSLQQTMSSLRRATKAALAANRETLETRRLAGKVVDGHGDLHVAHLWFDESSPDVLVVDCLEFRDDLRQIDQAADVAFLAMDLTYRGRADLAGRFVRRYARAIDDYGLYEVLDLFCAYRATVRAKVAHLSAIAPEIPASQRENASHSAKRHAELGLQFLAAQRRPGLVVMTGTVGSGKSTVAEYLADALDAVVISSDHVRRHVHATAAATDAAAASGPGTGRYEPELKQQVYEEMLNRAEAVVRSGRVAILDATFSKTTTRDAARRWAADHSLPAWLVRAEISPEVARSRLHVRSIRGQDASEAGPELLEYSLNNYEAPEEWPADCIFGVRTDPTDWHQSLEPIVATIAQGTRIPSKG